MQPRESDDERFEGHDERDCGEHRTLGARAWCFDCSEYCSPAGPCMGCEIPALRSDNERLREALKDLSFTSHPDLVPYDEAEHRRALQAANELL